MTNTLMTLEQLTRARALCERALSEGLASAERTESYELMEHLLDDIQRLRAQIRGLVGIDTMVPATLPGAGFRLDDDQLVAARLLVDSLYTSQSIAGMEETHGRLVALAPLLVAEVERLRGALPTHGTHVIVGGVQPVAARPMIPIAELKETALGVARAIDRAVNPEEDQPRRVGFLLMLFEFGAPGLGLGYVSNAQEQDLFKTVREWLARAEVPNPPHTRVTIKEGKDR